jgi:hypothetical protein
MAAGFEAAMPHFAAKVAPTKPLPQSRCYRLAIRMSAAVNSSAGESPLLTSVMVRRIDRYNMAF